MLISDAKIEEGMNWHLKVEGLLLLLLLLVAVVAVVGSRLSTDARPDRGIYKKEINKSLANLLIMRLLSVVNICNSPTHQHAARTLIIHTRT